MPCILRATLATSQKSARHIFELIGSQRLQPVRYRNSECTWDQGKRLSDTMVHSPNRLHLRMHMAGKSGRLRGSAQPRRPDNTIVECVLAHVACIRRYVIMKKQPYTS